MLWNRISRDKILKWNRSLRKLKRYSTQKRNISTRRRLLATNRKPKRKLSHILKNRGHIKKKRKISEVMNKNGEVDETDRISELPEHIIHKILNLLRSKDVARTGVFSKRWRCVWNSFLTFDFDQRNFQAGDEGKGKFIDFVENSLAARLEPLICIQKFRLYITSMDNYLSSRINNWLGAAINKNVRNLEIHVEVKKKRHYNLPQIVFTAKTVTSLKLHGCRLDNHGDIIKLPNIKELSIKKAHLDEDLVKYIITSCPLIEDMRFVSCNGLKSLKITTLFKLKRIETHECHGLKSVEIKLPNLESFWFHGKRSKRQCKINLKGCDNLKTLTLKDTYMTDELFQSQICQFPVLEKLVLKECNELKRIAIFSGKLKVLVLLRCRRLGEAIIDAPNLYSFEYTGNQMPFSSMNVSSLTEAKICFESVQKIANEIAFDVLSFLAKLRSKGLKLVVCNNENMFIYEKLAKLQVPDFNNLKLEITKSCLRLKEHFGSMLRDSFPEKLFIVSSPNSELLKFVKEKVKWGEETDLSCCRYYTRKCWRHYLKHVETLEFDEDLFACSLTPSSEITTLFNFEWKSTKDSCINSDVTTDEIVLPLPRWAMEESDFASATVLN